MLFRVLAPFRRVDPGQRKRIRLYAALATAALLLAMIGGAALLRRVARTNLDRSWSERDWQELPEVRLLQEYVRVDTSPTTGSEQAGAEFLAARLAEIGLEVHLERLGEKGANLWAILPGRRPEALVLHNHIDVYPVADPESWDYPPYGGVIDPPHLYGRGVFDMKSVTVAQLEAVRSLAESGRTPERSVIFLATGSEEVGGELGTHWVLSQHPELAARFWAVLTEGGVVEPVSRTQIKYWGIEYAHKIFTEVWLCAASPEPLEAARAALAELRLEEVAVLTPAVAEFLERYAPSRDQQVLRDLFADPQATVDDPERLAEVPAYVRAMLRNESVPFEVEPDPSGGHRLKVIVRLLPGVAPETVLDDLLPGWVTHGLAVAVEPFAGSAGPSPLDHPAYTTLADAVAEAYPQAIVGPYFLPWNATDARYFRARGVPAYGFSPFLIFATDTFRVDDTNERLSLPGFVDGVELYRRAVERLAG